MEKIVLTATILLGIFIGFQASAYDLDACSKYAKAVNASYTNGPEEKFKFNSFCLQDSYNVIVSAKDKPTEKDLKDFNDTISKTGCVKDNHAWGITERVNVYISYKEKLLMVSKLNKVDCQ